MVMMCILAWLEISFSGFGDRSILDKSILQELHATDGKWEHWWRASLAIHGMTRLAVMKVKIQYSFTNPVPSFLR